MTATKPHWQAFYEALIELYGFMLSEEQGCAQVLYQSKDHHLAFENSLDKHYRAILRVDDPSDLDKIHDHIEIATALFYEAVAQDAPANSVSPPKLPVYVPKIMTDEALFKIQVHENKAHSSEHYTKQDHVIVAACSRSKLSLPFDDEFSYRQRLQQTARALTGLGYEVIVEDSASSPYFTLAIDAKTLCDKHHCEGIQRRFSTGRQIRANFFTLKDGALQKSKLATVGVIVVGTDIDVLRSHSRAVRADAKYIKAHADEIILEVIPSSLRSGRLYKRN